MHESHRFEEKVHKKPLSLGYYYFFGVFEGKIFIGTQKG